MKQIPLFSFYAGREEGREEVKAFGGQPRKDIGWHTHRMDGRRGDGLDVKVPGANEEPGKMMRQEVCA